MVAVTTSHAINRYMSDDRLITAIGRIERALSRIETRSASKTASSDQARQLEQRHRELRERTQAVVERLDQLIGEHVPSRGGGSGMKG